MRLAGIAISVTGISVTDVICQEFLGCTGTRAGIDGTPHLRVGAVPTFWTRDGLFGNQLLITGVITHCRPITAKENTTPRLRQQQKWLPLFEIPCDCIRLANRR